MLSIDKLCYQSKLRSRSAEEKFSFAVLTLCVCVCCRRAAVSCTVLLAMGLMTVCRGGVPLAMGALAVRLLFTLPCFFAMAGAAWPLATELGMLSFGRGRRSAPVLYGSRYFLTFGVCVVVLTAGVFCERLLTPLLFRLALGGAAP